jgi:hypothetical protein
MEVVLFSALAILLGIMIGFVFVFVRVIVINSDFWLPMERLTFKGESAFVGYVLKGSQPEIGQDSPTFAPPVQ